MARYYPHSTPGSKDYHPDPIRDFEDTEWAHRLDRASAGEWSHDDQVWFEQHYALPGFKQFFDSYLDEKSRERIFNLYGIDYSDINDPRNVKGSQSNANLYRYELNFISDNAKFLYRKL